MPAPKPSIKIIKPKAPGKRPVPDAPPIYDTEPADGESMTVPELKATEEISELLQGFRDRAGREQQRYEDATDSEYWFAVCFQTRAQKDEFLQKMGWVAIGDKYLDGLKVARKLGVTITAETPAMPVLRVDRRLAQLAVPFVRRKPGSSQGG